MIYRLKKNHRFRSMINEPTDANSSFSSFWKKNSSLLKKFDVVPSVLDDI